jgi:hypothetical protein
MGPLGTPVSQTVRADDFTIETIELRLTSRSETPVRFAIGVWSANSSALVREALVEVPAQTADVWTRIDFAPLKLESDDTLEFQFFLPEREAGEIYIGAGLEDQYPDGAFKDHDGSLHVEQDISIRVWAKAETVGFLLLLIGRDPFGTMVVGLLLAFVAIAVYVEYSRRAPSIVAAVPATAVPIFVFALMYSLPQFTY